MSHTPRKRFGQNFLQDTTIIEQIIASAYPKTGQHWLEIGPGQGALTKPLSNMDITLDIVELDRDLVRSLIKQFAGQSNITIHSGDALKFNYAQLATHNQPLHIIGNLPYNISTPLLFHLLDFAEHIEEMYFMLQKEVVDRICAQPGNKKYGKLSVMLQFYCNTEFLFDVPRESFFPAPKVMSAVVRLAPLKKAERMHCNIEDLNTVVSNAFSQRRKTLKNALSKILNEEDIKALAINPLLRAESIELNDFVRLSRCYTEKNLSGTNSAQGCADIINGPGGH